MTPSRVLATDSAHLLQALMRVVGPDMRPMRRTRDGSEPRPAGTNVSRPGGARLDTRQLSSPQPVDETANTSDPYSSLASGTKAPFSDGLKVL